MAAKSFRGNAKMPASVRVISVTSIAKLDKINSGAFGTVYKGKVKGRHNLVALKISRREGRLEYLDTVREVTTMVDLKHDNVVKLIGISDSSPVPWLILELMHHGDLLDFLIGRKAANLSLSQEQMIQMSLDIARGMEYLHWKKLVVHCDLHTKNCMVSTSFVAKVGDFGLSQKLENEEVETARLNNREVGIFGRPNTPIGQMIGARWKAPELIPGPHFKAVFTRPCDVWAYGTLLFEFWAGGWVPYDPAPCEQVMEHVASGRTPLDFYTKFEAPAEILDIMKAAWNYSPNLRPNFKAIVATLKNLANLSSSSSASDSDSSLFS